MKRSGRLVLADNHWIFQPRTENEIRCQFDRFVVKVGCPRLQARNIAAIKSDGHQKARRFRRAPESVGSDLLRRR
jgi:hypothetical protein